MLIHLSYNIFNYVKFVLKFGGGFGGRLLTDWICTYVLNYWKNTCVKYFKSPGGILTLITLISTCIHCFNASADRHSFVMVVWLNMHWLNLKKGLIYDSITSCFLTKTS